MVTARSAESGKARPLPRRLAVCVGVLVCALVGIPPAPAWAHTTLRSATPADGEVCGRAPRIVVLSFSDRVSDLARVAVTASDGTAVTIGRPSIDGSRVAQPLREIATGTYTVDYRVVSQDGHPVTGRVRFRVAPVAAGSPRADAAAAIVEPSADEPTDRSRNSIDLRASAERQPPAGSDDRLEIFAAVLLTAAIGGGWFARRRRRAAE